MVVSYKLCKNSENLSIDLKYTKIQVISRQPNVCTYIIFNTAVTMQRTYKQVVLAGYLPGTSPVPASYLPAVRRAGDLVARR